MTSNAFSKTVSLALGQVQVREAPFWVLRELVPWLREKRWFMEKEAVITGVEQADAVVLVSGPDPAVYGLFVTFRLAADPDCRVPERQKRYFIPIILASSRISGVSAEDTVRLDLADGTLYFAFAEHSKLYQEPWFCRLAAGETLMTQRGGRIRFQVFSSLAESLTGGLEARPLNVEISTSNILTLVESGPVKWVSKTYKDLRGPSGEPGRKWPSNYEALRYEALTLAAYPNIPRLHGLVLYEDPGGTVSALGVVMDAVEKEGEVGEIFWSALDGYVKAWVDSKAAEEAFHWRNRQGAVAAAREIASTIAGMHAGFLASNRESFRPVAVSDQDLQSWAETPLRDVEAALSVLRKHHKSQPDGALAVLIQKLERDEGGLRQAAGVLRERGQGLMKAQIHGDLHTGQGLIAAGPGSHVIDRFLKEIEEGNADRIQSVAQELTGRVRWIDFEGVPAKTPVDDAEDGRDSPFLDLAGIAQGFCYIVNIRLYIQLGLPKPEDWAMASREDREKARGISLALAREMTPEEAAVPGLTAELINLLNSWLAEVTSAFLDSYLDEAEARGLGESLFAPWNRGRIKALVYFWILIRAAHELRYETYGRDWGWEAIPGGRILQILRNQDLASAL